MDVQRNTSRSVLLLPTVLAAASVLLFAGASTAQAQSTDPFDTAEFSVCTNVKPCTFTNPIFPAPIPTFPYMLPTSTFNDTTPAGGHSDLTFMMGRTRNGCHPNGDSGQFRNGPCDQPGDVFYYEQDVKNIAINFPPGLMPDANAAPYCDAYRDWVPAGGGGEAILWFCSNPNAVVGIADVLGTFCSRSKATLEQGDVEQPGCDLTRPGLGGLLQIPLLSTVYNERPRPGEQGRLVMLVRTPYSTFPNWPDFISPDMRGSYMKVEISVKVREDGTVEAVTEDIPPMLNQDTRNRDSATDEWEMSNRKIPIQLSDMYMKLWGSKGADKGHPLLTNPTFCGQQTVNAEIQAYGENSKPVIERPGSRLVQDVIPGSGEGKSRSFSLPFQATGCDTIPYSPTFTATSDTDAPGKPVALSTVITQKDNEATTKKVHVEFPKGMGLNLRSTLKPCTAAKPDRSNCPDSLMGTVEAESRLLPINPPNNGPLKGDVFLTGLKGDKLSLAVLLNGFVNLRFDATAGVDASGGLSATFDDLPPVPLSKFTLNLAGGSKSMLANPKACGTHTTKATFTSHSGKTHSVQSSSQVKGCTAPPAPEFEVDLSNNGKGKRTSVELEVSAMERHIKKVRFGLPRYLKFSTKRLGKKKNFGSVRVETERGELESSLGFGQSLRKKRKKKKAIRFGTKGALSDLKISLFKKKVGTKKVKIRTKSGKKKTLKRSVLKSRMSFKSLPKQDIKGLTVELNPSESRFIRNPRGCKKPLRFLVYVTTSDGVKHVLSQKVKLKGKGCSKKKAKKKR